MRQAVAVLFLIVSAMLVSSIPCHAVKLNTAAPDFSLKDLQGTVRTLSTHKGSVVLLNFWSTSCPPCVSELPSLNVLHKELRQNGLMVLGIALDSSDKPVRELLAKLKIEYPNMLDSSKDVYFDSYGLFGQPVSIIIDRTGTVREKIVGPLEWNSPQIRAKIYNYLKGR